MATTMAEGPEVPPGVAVGSVHEPPPLRDPGSSPATQPLPGAVDSSPAATEQDGATGHAQSQGEGTGSKSRKKKKGKKRGVETGAGQQGTEVAPQTERALQQRTGHAPQEAEHAPQEAEHAPQQEAQALQQETDQAQHGPASSDGPAASPSPDGHVKAPSEQAKEVKPGAIPRPSKKASVSEMRTMLEALGLDTHGKRETLFK